MDISVGLQFLLVIIAVLTYLDERYGNNSKRR